MTSTTRVNVENFSFLVEKSYKTVIDFNFDRHKTLSILKSNSHLSLVASVKSTFFRIDKSSCQPH